MSKETIVFFGSGPVAARSLELLVQAFNIEAVVTKPRPKHYHGNVPVLDLANTLNLRVVEATNKSELTRKVTEAHFASKAAILVDFGIIVDQTVIDSFPLGIINSHFSLLPQWRGADPITFAILSGQSRTGVSLMLLNDKMDEGKLLAQAHYDIPPDIAAPELTTDLIELSDALLKELVPLYLDGQITPAPQEAASIADQKTPTYSRKLTKEDGIIDWKKSAEDIEREVRAYIEWPKSHTKLANIDVIITKAHAVLSNNSGKQPGDIEVMKKESTLMVECGHGCLYIDRLKPAGKKDMSITEFLIGYGDKFKD